MMTKEDEIEALRMEIMALKATALTKEQRDAVDRLTDHVEQLVDIVRADTFRRTFLSTIRSWSVALAAVVAAIWVLRDGAARAVRALLE